MHPNDLNQSLHSIMSDHSLGVRWNVNAIRSQIFPCYPLHFPIWPLTGLFDYYLAIQTAFSGRTIQSRNILRTLKDKFLLIHNLFLLNLVLFPTFYITPF